LITLEELLIQTLVVADALANADWYADYKHEGLDYAELLTQEAETGVISNLVSVGKIDELRHSIADRIANETMNPDELRLAINILFKINTSLKIVFGADKPSKYPFTEFGPDELKLNPLEKDILVPPDLEKAELAYLKHRYEDDPTSLEDWEMDRLLDLLCKIDKDCAFQGIPFNTDSQFTNWFDNISYENFKILWEKPEVREVIESRIRYPGGLHEWCMVSRTDKFKMWSVTMEEIKRYRTPVSDVFFINPEGRHGGPGSTQWHNELLEIIDNSDSFTEFREKLNTWSDQRLKGGRNSLPEGLRN
jgi:hypothetical protein